MMEDVTAFIAYLLDAAGKSYIFGLVIIGVVSFFYGFFVVGRNKK